MSKKYVNAVVRCYKSISIADNNVLSYDLPFTHIAHDMISGNIVIKDFSVVVNIDFIGTDEKANKTENPLESRKQMDFIICLTKYSQAEQEYIGYDLDEFSIDLNEMHEDGQVNMACFEFLNYTRTTHVKKLVLPGGVGEYVIKILIKYSEESEYSIQAMSSIWVI